MKLASILTILLAIAGCSHNSPAPIDPRPAARAAVDVAKDAWVIAANACVAAVQSGSASNTVVEICSKNLDQAHDLIVVAADAVNATWNADAACDLVKGAKLLVEVANTLSSKDVSAVVNDAAVVAAGLAGGCQSDGGS